MSLNTRIRILLALVIGGWIIAPVVHRFGHVEQAPVAHTHESEGQGGFAEACERVAIEIEDCPICQIHVTAALDGAESERSHEAREDGTAGAETPLLADKSRMERVRGPPAIV